MPLSKAIEDKILKLTQARSIKSYQLIQKLWSDYGKLYRLWLEGGKHSSIILKHIEIKEQNQHPRNWNGQSSFLRKLKSYQVESYWYQHYAEAKNSKEQQAKLPSALLVEQIDDTEILLVIEDLLHTHPICCQQASQKQMQAAIIWLAQFHAQHLHCCDEHLWSQGGYWHLATRGDELAAIKDEKIQLLAQQIDEQLNGCQFKTIIHGDAKLANFCFSLNADEAAAVDFQYVGHGCGMQDLMLFLSSTLSSEQCFAQAPQWLDFYFQQLKTALLGEMSSIEFSALEQEWRSLYPIAWADFHRFLLGWAPEHWKLHHYSHTQFQQAIKLIQGK